MSRTVLAISPFKLTREPLPRLISSRMASFCERAHAVGVDAALGKSGNFQLNDALELPEHLQEPAFDHTSDISAAISQACRNAGLSRTAILAGSNLAKAPCFMARHQESYDAFERAISEAGHRLRNVAPDCRCNQALMLVDWVTPHEARSAVLDASRRYVEPGAPASARNAANLCRQLPESS